MKTFMMKTTSLVIALGAAILGSAPRARSQFTSDCSLPIPDGCPVETINEPRWTVPLIERTLYAYQDTMHYLVRQTGLQFNLDPFYNDFAPAVFPVWKLPSQILSNGTYYDVVVEDMTLPTQAGYSSAKHSGFDVHYLCGNLTTLPTTTYFEAYVTTTLSGTSYNYYEANLYADPTPPAGDPLRPAITVKGSITDSNPAVTHFFVRGNATIDSSSVCIDTFEEITLYTGIGNEYDVTGADNLPFGFGPVSAEFKMAIVQVARREGPPQVKQLWDNALARMGRICGTY